MIRIRYGSAFAVAALIATLSLPGTAAAGSAARISLKDGAGLAVNRGKVAWALINAGAGPGATASASLGSHPMSHSTVTDSAGNVSVPSTLGADEQAAVDANGGWANYVVVAFDRSGKPASFTAFSRYLGSEPSQVAEDVANGSGKDISLKIASPTVAKGKTAAPVSTSYTNCTNFRWQTYLTDYEFSRVGELHTAHDTASASFTYGKSADSQIDVGFKDGAGAWYVSGSSHVGNSQSSTAGITTSASNYGWGMETTINFNEDFFVADCFEGQGLYMGHSMTYATTWRGGMTNQINMSDQDNHRNSYWNIFAKGGTFSRDTSRFTKWSAAINSFGASLGIQSGASTFVKIAYKFGTAQNTHYLYGNNNTPPYSGRVFASDN